MTKKEAIEKCGRALLREKGYNEEMFGQYPNLKEVAENLVICLVALGLLKLDA
jgi:hypothetical protein